MGRTKSRGGRSRRWAWVTVAVIAVFLGGVAVGAGGTITRDTNPRCDTTAPAVHGG
ncbi:hypothetical protein [Gordonia sp. 852002-51296_SCH5728562-b]|uniref:hypothetical protein n=1 Tax=Gordonia sp. 852002-51296_SCH5728562-b TaxID=1834101 RepID=UPI000A7B4CD4|nr:hypothetical protein [Gordonia sp. 852002-51296_SCH5728562-b]